MELRQSASACAERAARQSVGPIDCIGESAGLERVSTRRQQLTVARATTFASRRVGLFERLGRARSAGATVEKARHRKCALHVHSAHTAGLFERLGRAPSAGEAVEWARQRRCALPVHSARTEGSHVSAELARSAGAQLAFPRIGASSRKMPRFARPTARPSARRTDPSFE